MTRIWSCLCDSLWEDTIELLKYLEDLPGRQAMPGGNSRVIQSCIWLVNWDHMFILLRVIGNNERTGRLGNVNINHYKRINVIDLIVTDCGGCAFDDAAR